MRLVEDESVEGPTVTALRAAGHLVLFIAETSPGIEDSEVLVIARKEQALLLTADKDFGELVFRNREPHCSLFGHKKMIRTKTRPTLWPQSTNTDRSCSIGFTFSRAASCGSELRE